MSDEERERPALTEREIVLLDKLSYWHDLAEKSWREAHELKQIVEALRETNRQLIEMVGRGFMPVTELPAKRGQRCRCELLVAAIWDGSEWAIGGAENPKIGDDYYGPYWEPDRPGLLGWRPAEEAGADAPQVREIKVGIAEWPERNRLYNELKKLGVLP